MKRQKKDIDSSALPPARFTEEIWAVRSVMVRRTSRTFAPPTDVIEFPDRLVVLIEIAGMRTADFQIALHNRNLIVSGIRERPPFDNPAYHRVEIGFGEFRVEIPLPWSVDQDQVGATYGEGFLQIDLPRAAGDGKLIIDPKTGEQD